MRKSFSLRGLIYLILTALVAITLVGALVTVWYTYRMEGLLNNILDRNVAAFQEAEALENALVNQKGFVSYYFLDGNPDWLRQLGEYRQIFRATLERVRNLAETERQKEAVERIKREYNLYTTGKDQVIAHYRAGEKEAGARLHSEVRTFFFKTLQLCEQYKELHKQRIEYAMAKSHAEARGLRIIVGTAMLIVILLGLLLIFVLVSQILGPIRQIAREAEREGASGESRDEVKALGLRVRGLIENVDQTQEELERSRAHLLEAEKMALVGKLAAGVAHTIRNPLTSVKMRLFSLSRTLDLSVTQKEDFEVISEEVGHIDTIVQNFLEFSRPPKLKMQEVSPSEVVDLVLQLLEHRLKSYDVDIEVSRKQPLPEIELDPEQLKEVLVNLIINACEAMGGGGSMTIHEEASFEESLGRVVVIRLTDNGPGISESIKEKIFEPFFTTKDEGSGLGLSIALRIVEEHGGRLDLTSKEGQGSTFVITLPINHAKT
jgi:signal transduction histidine kinase